MAGVGWGESKSLSGVEVTEGMDDGPVERRSVPPYVPAASFVSRFFNDDDGNPAGGVTSARGILISWQRGPLVVDGVRIGPNGAFVEDVIVSAIDRLTSFQSTKFQCSENMVAITHLEAALRSLQERRVERAMRCVDGTHSV
jgi:hypothetical protein